VARVVTKPVTKELSYLPVPLNCRLLLVDIPQEGFIAALKMDQD